MSFLSLRFGKFCDFCPKVCFSNLDPKGLKSCHFHPAISNLLDPDAEKQTFG
ncbi:hypothetical protein HanIR_Chr10g0458191 [Helianthus annuus]|nr:hypothetical protein HanIR_Chr10g0458191 [Helianthus annuus]